MKAPPRINPGWVSGIRGERCVTCRPDYDGLADVSPVTPLLPTRISLSGPDGATQSPLQPVPLECSRSQSVRRIGYIVATTTKASLPQPQRQTLADCRTLEGSASRQEHDPTCPAAPTRTHRAKTPGGTLSLDHGHNKENTASIRFIETDLHPNERYPSPTFDVPYL